MAESSAVLFEMSERALDSLCGPALCLICGGRLMTASDIRARVTLNIQASAGAVFAAWIDPTLMEQWFFKSPDNRLSARSDPRVGGSYSITEYAADQVITHDGIYTIVDPPRRLAFSLTVPQHFVGIAHIEIEIRQVGSGSQLDFLARNAGPEDAQEIWERMLSELASVAQHNDP
jgi:uncharacterized protein YndB with AHSA1/START domain